MANAKYTLIIGGQKHGFRMDDVDFSAPLASMAYGLGETVVDSMQWQGVKDAEVTVENSNGQGKRYGFTAVIDPALNRNEQVLHIGTKLANATYNALEGAAA